jgi:uncharacterized protein YkwD
MLARLVVIAAALMAVSAVQPALAAASSTPPRKLLVKRINHVRARHGLAPVSSSRALHVAAIRHSDDMMGRDYFAHTSPTGSTMTDRILKTGYVSGYNWLAGETLAWGWGTQSGPRATVRAWMHSPEHRAILLSPKYRTIGVARACGRFLGYSGACVWTADWVTRW